MKIGKFATVLLLGAAGGARSEAEADPEAQNIIAFGMDGMALNGMAGQSILPIMVNNWMQQQGTKIIPNYF